jgi:hypothetical protein
MKPLLSTSGGSTQVLFPSPLPGLGMWIATHDHQRAQQIQLFRRATPASSGCLPSDLEWRQERIKLRPDQQRLPEAAGEVPTNSLPAARSDIGESKT